MDSRLKIIYQIFSKIINVKGPKKSTQGCCHRFSFLHSSVCYGGNMTLLHNWQVMLGVGTMGDSPMIKKLIQPCGIGKA